MRYLITGGTGFIGSAWIKQCDPEKDHVIVLSRKKRDIAPHVRVISDLSELTDDESIDVVINLAGATIAQRWSDAVKKELMDSRVNTTEQLITLIERLDKKPRVMLSASAIGYYGDHDQQTLDEQSTPKPSFTHDLCDAWEKAAKRAEPYGVRLCILRLGVVLAEGGGFISKVALPFKCGLGGRLGSGHQLFSWVHRDDVLRVFQFCIKSAESQGVYNVVAPNRINNADFTKCLASAVNRPALCHMPASIVRVLYGEMGKALLLRGSFVAPKRLEKAGFSFAYTDPKQALADIFS